MPPEATEAISRLKGRLREGEFPEEFENRAQRTAGTGSPLPKPAQGCRYVEVNVGQAHPNDPSQAGVMRLVAEINAKSMQILDLYFTNEHYAKGSFHRIV